jgi:fucose permease
MTRHMIDQEIRIGNMGGYWVGFLVFLFCDAAGVGRLDIACFSYISLMFVCWSSDTI